MRAELCIDQDAVRSCCEAEGCLTAEVVVGGPSLSRTWPPRGCKAIRVPQLQARSVEEGLWIVPIKGGLAPGW